MGPVGEDNNLDSFPVPCLYPAALFLHYLHDVYNRVPYARVNRLPCPFLLPQSEQKMARTDAHGGLLYPFGVLTI